MQHLSEEQLIEHHYRDGDGTVTATEHLSSCHDCAQQYDTIRRVLDLVSEVPVPDRGEGYGEQVWTRVRWKLGSSRRRQWRSMLAAAAMLALAFMGGYMMKHRATSPAESGPWAAATPVEGTTLDTGRVLLFVVGDHLDTSERVLLEVANAQPGQPLDNSTQQKRVQELVAANRIYRQTAAHRGDSQIAQLLADLEPILIELSNAGSTLDAQQLSNLQKRIESKALLFKVRVISAQTSKPEQTSTTDTL